MAKKDYYAILGVGKDATGAQIRAAYKKLARKYHPDVNPGDKRSEERFKEIAEAYAVLSNKGKRAEYDRRGPEGFDLGFDPSEIFRRARAGGVEGFDFSFDLGSLFGDLFGGGGRRRRRGPARGADAEASLDIDFEDAVRGVTLPLSVSRTAPCETCGGTGTRGGGGTCSACGGRGRRQVAQGPLQFTTTCERCGGSGREPGPPCPECGGRGAVPRSESLQVRIPAGMADGSRVRIRGKGEAGPGGGHPGDLYVVIRVRPHPLFRREGDDLVADLPLTLSEAALGDRIEVPTLDGPATMTIPPGTRSGQRFRLRGKGAPRPGAAGRGDLYVVAQIVPPKDLDAESRDLLRRFAERNPQPDLRDRRRENR
jgi:molecular chaperone DnaJ